MSLGIVCSSGLTGFLELYSRGTVQESAEKLRLFFRAKWKLLSYVYRRREHMHNNKQKTFILAILARVFAELPSFFSQIVDLIYGSVLIFIVISFKWRDTENQQ